MTLRRNPRFFTDVVRRRYAAGSYVAGEWVDGAVTEATIKASVQPASGKDLNRLPEGLRTSDAVMVFAGLDELRTADETSRLPADRIVHLGEEYEVHSVDVWAMPQMPHVEAMAVRVDRLGAEPPESPA